MASFRRALPSLARCDRPRKAFSRLLRDQPGRLAQGPEEKWVLTGRLAGLRAVVISLSFQIDAPRWGGVARGGSAGKTPNLSRKSMERRSQSLQNNANVWRTSGAVCCAIDQAPMRRPRWALRPIAAQFRFHGR